MTPSTRKTIERINSSVEFDWRLARQDIDCTQAHFAMLQRQGLLTDDEYSGIAIALSDVAQQVQEGRLDFRPEFEDVHTNIEKAVVGLTGSGALWMARARNDHSVTVFRMWLRETIDRIGAKLTAITATLADLAHTHADLLMPGLTHMQAAQPVTWGHVCHAYGEMFLRDIDRFQAARSWMNRSPLGACALAGTSFDINRDHVAARLGFDGPTANSIDSVADRDFVLDYLNAAATSAIHLSRIAEDFIVWLTPQFDFFSLPDFLVTGSAIMPHKRNPDALELVRGRAARVLSNLSTVQIMLKGLTMSYARDLQEDKEAVFDTTDILELSLDVFDLVFRHAEPNAVKLAAAAEEGFTTSTDYADWICRNTPLSFAQAHHATTALVAVAQAAGCGLSDLTSAQRAKVAPVLAVIAWPHIDARSSVQSRTSLGGTAPDQVRHAAHDLSKRLAARVPDAWKQDPITERAK
jgi:argininosuccinate lyase